MYMKSNKEKTENSHKPLCLHVLCEQIKVCKTRGYPSHPLFKKLRMTQNANGPLHLKNVKRSICLKYNIEP